MRKCHAGVAKRTIRERDGLRPRVGHAKPARVTTGAATSEGAVDAWRAVRSDSDIQFAPIAQPDPPQTPEWLRALGEFLVDLLGPVARLFVAAWPVLMWVLIAVGVALLVLLLVLVTVLLVLF